MKDTNEGSATVADFIGANNAMKRTTVYRFWLLFHETFDSGSAEAEMSQVP